MLPFLEKYGYIYKLLSKSEFHIRILAFHYSISILYYCMILMKGY